MIKKIANYFVDTVHTAIEYSSSPVTSLASSKREYSVPSAHISPVETNSQSLSTLGPTTLSKSVSSVSLDNLASPKKTFSYEKYQNAESRSEYIMDASENQQKEILSYGFNICIKLDISPKGFVVQDKSSTNFTKPKSPLNIFEKKATHMTPSFLKQEKNFCNADGLESNTLEVIL